MCGKGGHVWQRGACVVKGRGMCGEGGLCVAKGGVCDEGACVAGWHVSGGHEWQGACMAGVCMWWGCAWQRGMCGRGACMAGEHVWQEGQPLQRTVRILLECILVFTSI